MNHEIYKHPKGGWIVKAYELFPGLAKAVKEAHEKHGLTASGHDFDHDLRVAAYALMIAPDKQTGRLAAAAGFCHSADRILGSIASGGLEEPEKETEIGSLVREWLNTTDLTSEERDEIVFAVLHHEGANDEADTLLKITLCDADRLANLDADVLIRGGQFQPHLLVVDPVHFENDPEATYRDPRSILWDVKNCISWTKESGPYVLRLPKARELGASRGAFLQLFIDKIHAQRSEVGLVPYPEL